MPRSSASAWFTAASRPRLAGLLLVLVVLALGFGRLGAWQLDRAAERGRIAAERAAAQAAAVGPVDLDRVLLPGRGLTQEGLGVQVRVRGEFVPDLPQYRVAEPGPDGADGWLAVAAFEVREGAGSGVLIPVARGWRPADDGARAPAPLPAVPEGPVEVVGYLAPSEAALGAGPGSGDELGSVSSAQLANLWRVPIYGAHVRAAEVEAGAGLAPLAPASVVDPGLNLQNLAYAAQWWIFAGFALVLWLRLVRDEVRRTLPAGENATHG